MTGGFDFGTPARPSIDQALPMVQRILADCFGMAGSVPELLQNFQDNAPAIAWLKARAPERVDALRADAARIRDRLKGVPR